MTKALLIPFVLIALVILLMGATRGPSFHEYNISLYEENASEELTILDGDSVGIRYTITDETGAVLHTTEKETAIKEKIFDPKESYTPLIVSIGYNEVLKPLEDALLGMKVAEEKTVEIPKDEAYGERDPALVETVERTQKSPRKQTSSREEFIKETGVEPKPGLKTTAKSLGWPIEVLTTNQGNVTYQYNPDSKTTLETPFGTAKVTADEETLSITLSKPEVGARITTGSGTGTVVSANDTHITLDFNHELAGKTLTYWVKIASIHPSAERMAGGDSVTLKYFWSEFCPYCKKQEPILQEVLAEHPSLNFIRIDVNKQESVREMRRYKARSTPTFVLIDNKSVKIGVGLLTKKRLTSYICSKLKDEACSKIR